ncbi:MAG: hypothetical protein E7627_08560 [Ruminococcaceae bacterium]|nr:hypothetical protein [Oscillospiraceae bacterium]
MKSQWKDKSVLHKIVAIISIIASLSVIVLSTLQIFDIWDEANNISIPMMGIILLCQAFLQWNTSRKVAYFSIGTAVFIFICAIVVFLIR